VPTKVIVTAEGPMKRKYRSGWTTIRKAVHRLTQADAKRGITTSLVALDGAGLGRRRARLGRPETFKEAVDHVWALQNQPDYVLVLGGPDIVPHQRLRNPIDDDDADVPSDLPYACNAPGGDDPETFLGASRVVGRLPDLPGDRRAALLAGLLDGAAAWKPKTRAVYRSHFSVSAHTWRRSTTLSLKALFGAKAVLHTSPFDGPQWTKAETAPLCHFINCHGAEVDSQFYGEKDGDFPVALQAIRLPRRISTGTIAAVECCYGAELYPPNGGTAGICIGYLREGAIGFVGSTNIAYGPASKNGEADLICRFFLESVLNGASLGRALLEARLRFIEAARPLSPADLKTVAQFLLLGDPALRAVGPTFKVGDKAFAKKVTTHAITRGHLGAEAATLAKGVDTVASVPDGAPRPAVMAALKKAALAEGCTPRAVAKSFHVRMGRDPASRAALTAKAFVPTRYHAMLTKPAESRRPAARASRGGKSGGERHPRPMGVKDDVLLLAREVGGKVVEVERLYAHRRATTRTNGRSLRRPGRQEALRPRLEERASGRGLGDGRR
jgi:hypothetical protein